MVQNFLGHQGATLIGGLRLPDTPHTTQPVKQLSKQPGKQRSKQAKHQQRDQPTNQPNKKPTLSYLPLDESDHGEPSHIKNISALRSQARDRCGYSRTHVCSTLQLAPLPGLLRMYSPNVPDWNIWMGALCSEARVGIPDAAACEPSSKFSFMAVVVSSPLGPLMETPPWNSHLRPYDASSLVSLGECYFSPSALSSWASSSFARC